MKRSFLFLWVLIQLLASCSQPTSTDDTEEDAAGERITSDVIVSLNPTATEILFAIGKGGAIALRDVASVTPEAASMIPLAGDRHSFNMEAILAQKPTLVIGAEEDLDPHLVTQLRSANVEVLLIRKPNSIADTKHAIEMICTHFGDSQQEKTLLNHISCENRFEQLATRCLFIYAAGGGSLLVGGGDTSVGQMIKTAGGQNAAEEISGFKPLSPEALVAYNPDCLIFFDHGFQAIGGMEGILSIPGIDQTNAARHKRVVTFPAHAISGYGLQYCQNLNDLHNAIQ